MDCEKCGNEMNPQVDSCQKCGVPKELPMQTPTCTPPNSKPTDAGLGGHTALHLICGTIALLMIFLWFRPCVGAGISIFGFSTSVTMSMQEICESGGVGFVTSAMTAAYILTAALMLFPVWRKGSAKPGKSALVPLFVSAVTLFCQLFAYFGVVNEMEEEFGSVIANAMDISLAGGGVLTVLLSIALLAASVVLLVTPRNTAETMGEA